MPTATKTQTTAAPESLDDCPAYVAAREKLRELHERRDQLQNEIDDAVHALGNMPAGIAQRRTEAEALLAGHLPEDQRVTTRSNLAAKQREFAILETAIELQQDRERDARRVASVAVRTGMLAEHRDLASAIRDSLESLRVALVDEQVFRDRLDSMGVGFGHPFKSIAFPRIGDPSAPDGAIAYWLRETANY